MSELSLEVAGEELIARADGSLFWKRKRTLFAADVHFGKAAAFRARAVPVPNGTTRAILERLTAALEATGADQLVFLGDLWHDRYARTEAIVESVSDWRQHHKNVSMTLVEGNHDIKAGKLPGRMQMSEVAAPHALEPFLACHHPCEHDEGYVLAGHVHPAVRLTGLAEQSMKLPCFWFGERSAILPTFGEFTGYGIVKPKSGDRVFALADGGLFALKTD
jgi:DNA ligase-associated metallophosphoesterase